LYYQPIYHIDLFFQPLFFNQQNQIQLVVIAKPSEDQESLSRKAKYRLDNLRNALNEVKSNLRKDLENQVKIIEAPIQITFDEDGEVIQYDNFLNGLFEYRNNELHYLQPVNPNENEVRKVRRKKFNTELVSGVKMNLGTELKIEEVPTVYSKDAGLRCRIKVLDWH
jgi:hypothetical protein